MVMEMAPGERLCSRMASLSNTIAHDVLSKIFDALDYLHNKHRIAHRDLKGENIITSAGPDTGDTGQSVDVKLIDFGSAYSEKQDMHCSCPFALSQSSTMSSMHSGMDQNILPPACKDGRGDSFKLDVFAAGLVVVGLLAKKEKFTNDLFVGCTLTLSVPELTLQMEQYVTRILNHSGRDRLDVAAVRRQLPSPACWFAAT